MSKKNWSLISEWGMCLVFWFTWYDCRLLNPAYTFLLADISIFHLECGCFLLTVSHFETATTLNRNNAQMKKKVKFMYVIKYIILGMKIKVTPHTLAQYLYFSLPISVL
jgi:hypothetical protein